MTDALPPILLVGGGKMGGAMLAGWRERGMAAAVVIDPAPGASLLAGGPVKVVTAAAEVPADFRPAAVVLAVKPQSAAEAVPPIARLVGDAVVLSIMAGKTVAGLRRLVGEKAIVRAMPNTPAAVRQGITVGFAGPGVTATQKDLSDELLSSIGEVAWVADEGLIDPVTAVSGGGPAYVFLLAETMERAAIEQGIPPELARRLARVTVSGSGALLRASDQDAADLRVAVTSPGGTTQRALAVLMEAWPGLMSRAIQAATERSRELGG
ncbi:MAG: pyrroline-5-carboxylate reductase [Acetobacteraceae bacterium]|nr:pyrroline-5-carboxylate reductase [Acetobacteraceae bacterium]